MCVLLVASLISRGNMQGHPTLFDVTSKVLRHSGRFGINQKTTTHQIKNNNTEEALHNEKDFIKVC